MPSLSSYLIISAILFSLGLFGVITRRNGVAVLMSVELILNAANINFVAFARFGGMDFSGHVFSLFVIIYITVFNYVFFTFTKKNIQILSRPWNYL